MLDRAHPKLDRATDRFGRIGVGENISTPGPSLLDDRPHLLFAVLQVPDRIVRRGDAARGQDLDLGRTFAQLVAGGAAAFRDAVGDARTRQAPRAAGTSFD